MDRRWILAGSGMLLLGIAGVAMVSAEPSRGRAFIAGDQPVTEDQVRQKLQSDGCRSFVMEGISKRWARRMARPPRLRSTQRPAGCEPPMMMMTTIEYSSA
jgi:hypothetical protein